VWGWLLATLGLPLMTLLFVNIREHIGLPTVLLLYLVLAMVVALVGGVLPALVAVVGGFLLANWFFTPPLHVLTITDPEDLLALVVYAFAAGTVALLVDRVGRSRLRATRLQAEAETLAALAGSLAEPGSVGAMLAQLRATFGYRAATLLRRGDRDWSVLVASGTDPPQRPEHADLTRDIGSGVVLALAGGTLSGRDERVLDSFAAQLTAANERDRLQHEASKAADLAAANTLRASLLQAVSHDLRTPLASIKASISSLRQRDIEWSPEARDDFEATIEQETDRLTHIIGNLLDMSRVQAAALAVERRPVGVDEVVLAAVASLGTVARDVAIDIPDSIADVIADPPLLERALANLVDNAIRYAAADQPPRLRAGEVVVNGHRRIDIRVIDRGPGIRPADRELAFLPFQRLVDHQADGRGVGLGLAIARGFVEAMDGELTVEDTPGGGATMVVSMPAAATDAP
jgi:two-component system sensor histidine kinase KdpD